MLTSSVNVPRWRSTHGLWAERVAVNPDRIPQRLRQLQAEVASVDADLTTAATPGRRRRHCELVVVQRLANGQLAMGRGPEWSWCPARPYPCPSLVSGRTLSPR